MSKIPRIPHVKVKEPNTDLQEAIIEAVEEHYPDLQLKEIAELEEVDCNQSTVSRVVEEFMKPVREDELEGELEEESPHETPTLTLNIDDEDVPAECIRYYVKGKSEGFEEGFAAALEWAEDHMDLPEGSIRRGSTNPR